MNNEQKVSLVIITMMLIFLVALISVLVSESTDRLKVDCRIEGMRANRTTTEIMELCK